MARPQYEARTRISGLLRFLLCLLLLRGHDSLPWCVCGGPLAGFVQVAGFDPLSDLGLRPLTANDNDTSRVRTAMEKRK
jgi:hypothetical protein